MTELRPLRGGCQCGRNRYIIAVPQDGLNDAQVLFNTEPEHQIPLATPLAAYIRVPLTWFHSTTYAFFPDETHNSIRRVYTHPTHSHAKRHFCGYCGTPLSYWSEQPREEAEFINLTIGSLLREDLQDLEDMGLLPEENSEASSDDDKEKKQKEEKSEEQQGDKRKTALTESYGVPWFDGLVEGTRLGNMRTSRGVRSSADGRVKVQWEVTEWDGDDQEDTDMGSASGSATPGKRKRDESAGAADDV